MSSVAASGSSLFTGRDCGAGGSSCSWVFGASAKAMLRVMHRAITAIAAAPLPVILLMSDAFLSLTAYSWTPDG